MLHLAIGGEAYVTPAVANGVIDARAQIQQIKDILAGWDQLVDGHPDDQARKPNWVIPQSHSLDWVQSVPVSNGVSAAPLAPHPLTLIDPGDPVAPFVAEPPVIYPRSFFGRDPIVRRIFDLLKHLPLQNAIIIDPRRSGKSSLLH